MKNTRKNAEVHLAESERCRERGELGRSFSHLSLALLLSSHLKQQYYSLYLDIFEKWSEKVETSQGFSQVLTLYEVALNHYPNSPDLHYLLASTLYRHGNVHEAWNHACVVQAKCPHDPWSQDIRDRLTNCLVDRWHIPMLNDVNRNTCFRQAITQAVTQGCRTVLDIGSGTGLLSVYAAQAGSQEVYACEEDKFMSEISSSILQRNKNSNTFKILNKNSKNICIPSDISQKVSLVVSETVDAGLFGEHILSTLQHAWQHLLLPPQKSQDHINASKAEYLLTKNSVTSPQVSSVLVDGESLQTKDLSYSTAEPSISNTSKQLKSSGYGRVIPSRAEAFVALISCSHIAKLTKYQDSNVQCLKNKHVRLKLEEPYMSEKLICIPGGFKLMSDWMKVTTVDFNSLEDIEKHLNGEVNKTFTLTCVEDGSIDAIILAFNLYLDENNYIQTFPDPSIQTVWENAVYPVTYPLSVVSEDSITVDFQCFGVINLSVKEENFPYSFSPDSVNLNTYTLRFLNSRNFVNAFQWAAQEAFMKIEKCRENNGSTTDHHSITICDALPFPVAGLYLQSLLPDSYLYVEDEEIQRLLRELDIDVGLCEEIQEKTLDVLFIWPVTQEGTLTDRITTKIQTYRKLMTSDGLVFPKELELVVDAVKSPLLQSFTQVSDDNTCGVSIAKIFNMVQTNHQLDVTLSSLPDTSSVFSQGVPMMKISLVSGVAETLGEPQRSLVVAQGVSGDLLVLGGEVVEAITHVTLDRGKTINALPYWFRIKFGIEEVSNLSSAAIYQNTDIVLSTLDEDSPCNQCVFMLKRPLKVTQENLMIRVLWRDGIFSAVLEQT